MKVRVNTALGVRVVVGGGQGKEDISYQHSDVMYVMCSKLQEAETPPAGVCDSRGNSCCEIIGTKEVPGRKEATSVPPPSFCCNYSSLYQTHEPFTPCSPRPVKCGKKKNTKEQTHFFFIEFVLWLGLNEWPLLLQAQLTTLLPRGIVPPAPVAGHETFSPNSSRLRE